MEKIFVNSNATWPGANYNDLLLAINGKAVATIKVKETAHNTFVLEFVMLDCSWSKLPILAADLYQHCVGPEPCGYASIPAALAAAMAILECRGWKRDSRNTEAGFARRECLVLSSGIVSIGFVMFYLLGVDLIWCLIEIVKTLS